MIRFLLNRILISIITLFLLSIVVFSIVHLAPGDPALLMLPPEASQEDIAEIRKALELDKPFVLQYFVWAGRVLRLDFGNSIRARYPASRIFLERLPATLELTLASVGLAVIFAIPLGVVAAIRRDAFWDVVTSFVSLLGLSAPRFWMGLVLILIFSLHLHWFPPFGREIGLFYGFSRVFYGEIRPIGQALSFLALPSITLATWFFAVFLKHTRANMLEELQKLYVKTARQKGINEIRVLMVHVLRNALIPIVTVIGVQTGRIIGGAVVVEIVFAWPGVGKLLLTALFARDYPVIQATLLMIGLIIVLIFIVLDILYMIIDPRILVHDSR